MSPRRTAVLIALLALVCSLFVSLPALAESNVRIVRISYIQGDAQVDPTNDDDQFTHAVLNMPVTQGMWVYTPQDGRAEIEFENGSTVRLVDDAQVQFEKLARSDSGGTVDVINIDHGVIYLDFRKVKDDDSITINAGTRAFKVKKSSHLRIEAGEENVSVAVFKGNAVLEGETPVDIKSDETLAFEPSNAEEYELAKNVDRVDSDTWDKERNSEVEVASNNKGPDYPDAYSAQFNYLGGYGNYYNVPGYGWGWQPYGIGAGWDPFMSGLWGFYPGYGYMWISSYPWGWAPYRYGAWNYVPSYGWMWMPGSTFNSWHVGPRYGTVPAGWHAPVAPTSPATGRPPRLVVVGHPTNVHPAVLAGRSDVQTHVLNVRRPTAGAPVAAGVQTKTSTEVRPATTAATGKSTGSGRVDAVKTPAPATKVTGANSGNRATVDHASPRPSGGSMSGGARPSGGASSPSIRPSGGMNGGMSGGMGGGHMSGGATSGGGGHSSGNSGGGRPR